MKMFLDLKLSAENLLLNMYPKYVNMTYIKDFVYTYIYIFIDIHLLSSSIHIINFPSVFCYQYCITGKYYLYKYSNF